MACLICEQIAPDYGGPRYLIHDGRYWQLEHMSAPTAVMGWLRLIMKRHVEALHELMPEEFSELSYFLAVASGSLFAELGCDKEYVMCFSEGEGTRHIHVHIVAKQVSLSQESRGANIFSLLNVPTEQAVPVEAIRSLVWKLQQRIKISAAQQKL